MLKKTTFWIVLVLVLTAGAGGYYYYQTRIAAVEAAGVEQAAMQTAVARRGELVILASGTGQVVPAFEIALGFDESGTLLELNVAVGDKVEAGEVLAHLQTKDSDQRYHSPETSGSFE